MKLIDIKLNCIEKVKAFTQDIANIDDFYYVMTFDGKHEAMAKSILGIFSLDLTEHLVFFKYADKEHKELTEIESKVYEIIQKYKA